MKKIGIIVLLIVSAGVLKAQPPKGKANAGDTYGAKVDVKDAIQAAELPAQLAKKDTVSAKIKGKAMASCASKGCWMTLQVNDSTTAFIKMKDYAFFVPMAIAGKTVVVDGVAYTKTTSVAELKHYAEDGKKSQKEIDAITQPKNEIRIMANGITVVE
ncbi:MAG: hypothetical protein K0S33_2348 [Bacteroidetes bacterium]|jgi:hypothetical protein|nr:hypothetical protein [Bacteroidota bacterium]